MKRWNGLIAAILLLGLAALALQAVQAKDEPAAIKNETIKIGDIFKNESAYQDNLVSLEGKITTECPMGCWFVLDDGSQNITVDLKPDNFVIPQKKGSTAKVYGKVSFGKFQSKDNSAYILGKSVEIEGEIFKAKEPVELNNATVTIGDLLKSESQYLGKAVVAEGNIETECQMGCWFILNDGTGSVSVDLAPHNFTVPQREGSKAKIYGKVANKDNTTYIYAEIIKIGEEIFR